MNMGHFFNKKYKALSMIIVFAMMFTGCFAAFSSTADAASTSIVFESGSDSTTVGKSIDITVNSSASGTITVKFSSDKLEYTKCDVSGASCSGNKITFSGRSGRITFKAIAAGKANLIVSCSAADGCSAQLTIAEGSGTATETNKTETNKTETNTTQTNKTETNKTENTTPAAGATTVTGAESDKDKANENQSQISITNEADASFASGTVDANGVITINSQEFVIDENFTDSQIFRNFYAASINVGGKEYKSINNNARTMLYLRPKNGGEAKFYFYNPDAGTVELPKYLGNADYYVLLSTKEFAKDELPSSRFMSTNKIAEFGSYTVYTFSGSEFYYIYGYDALGNEGWYTYDTKTARIGRVDVIPMVLLERQIDAMSATYDPADVYKVKLERFRRITVALIIVLIILIVVIVNLFVRKNSVVRVPRRRYSSTDGDVFDGADDDEDEEFDSDDDDDNDDDSDDDDDDDDDDDEDDKPRRRFGFFRRREKEDDFDIFAGLGDSDDDDDDDEDEDEDDEPIKIKPIREVVKTPEKSIEIPVVKAPEKEIEIPVVKAPEKEIEIPVVKAPEKKVEIPVVKAPVMEPVKEPVKETKTEPEFSDDDLLIPDISSFMAKNSDVTVSQMETDLEKAIILEAMKDEAEVKAPKKDPVASGTPGSKTSIIDLNDL